MFGYTGKLLFVDLRTGKIWQEPINEGYAKAFVGGSGLAARYMFERIDPSTSPLGPNNPLIFMTGPLVGTGMQSAGRYSVCAISPLTGIWGEANSGGHFGPELRYAGYDGIIITGKAERPVWLSIIEGEPQLHSAEEIWGRDMYTTQSQIRLALAQPKARVACIGLAGENQVKMAGIMNDDGRTAARTGLGAVMGSKNLKAIAVRGAQHIPLADPQGFKTSVNSILSGMKDDLAVHSLRLTGTAGYMDVALMYGDMPIRYFQQGEWEPASELSGILMRERYLLRNSGCHRCAIACCRETHAIDYNDAKVDGPEYETLGAFGSLMMISDQQAVIHANHLCNLYGLDTISTGSTIALACELFERGLLSSKETGGVEIRYGDASGMLSMIECIARREGFGDVLADGSACLAERFGAPELAVTVNRLEVPMHDPRAFTGMAVTYALSPRGACHMEGDMYSLDTGQFSLDEFETFPGDRFEMSMEKGRMAARVQAWRNLYNSLIVCQFENPGVMTILNVTNQATGWDLQPTDLLTLGKRIVTIKRLLNFKRGLTRLNDILPELLLKPLSEGGTEGITLDLDSMLRGAYADFGWDPLTGIPLPETIQHLGYFPQ